MGLSGSDMNLAALAAGGLDPTMGLGIQMDGMLPGFGGEGGMGVINSLAMGVRQVRMQPQLSGSIAHALRALEWQRAVSCMPGVQHCSWSPACCCSFHFMQLACAQLSGELALNGLGVLCFTVHGSLIVRFVCCTVQGGAAAEGDAQPRSRQALRDLLLEEYEGTGLHRKLSPLDLQVGMVQLNRWIGQGVASKWLATGLRPHLQLTVFLPCVLFLHVFLPCTLASCVQRPCKVCLISGYIGSV